MLGVSAPGLGEEFGFSELCRVPVRVPMGGSTTRITSKLGIARAPF